MLTGMSFDEALAHRLNLLAGKSGIGDAVIVLLGSYLPLFLIVAYVSFIWSHAYEPTVLPLLYATLGPALFARFLLVPIIRYFYRRPRPYDSMSVHPLFTVREYSFPSGHAVFFCALATSVAFFMPVFAAILFVATSISLVSRVIAGVHYPSDILVGALLGTLVSWAMYTVQTFF
jgi:membrane-associated phospholipid phosphatase